MYRKVFVLAVGVMMMTVAASAADLGGHVGYFGDDLKKVYVGADLMLPLGSMLAIDPNIDYTKTHGVGVWWGNGDLVLRFPHGSGMTWWIGGGPAYYYETYHGDSYHDWGWGATAGLAFGAGSFRPYITGRYDKAGDDRVTGVTVGLRFGK
jgi:hypothetical protein